MQRRMNTSKYATLLVLRFGGWNPVSRRLAKFRESDLDLASNANLQDCFRYQSLRQLQIPIYLTTDVLSPRMNTSKYAMLLVVGFGVWGWGD